MKEQDKTVYLRKKLPERQEAKCMKNGTYIAKETLCKTFQGIGLSIPGSGELQYTQYHDSVSALIESQIQYTDKIVDQYKSRETYTFSAEYKQQIIDTLQITIEEKNTTNAGSKIAYGVDLSPGYSDNYTLEYKYDDGKKALVLQEALKGTSAFYDLNDDSNQKTTPDRITKEIPLQNNNFTIPYKVFFEDKKFTIPYNMVTNLN